MPQETQIEQIRSEINSENCLCANFQEPKKSDFSDKKGILKKDNEIKECPPISFAKDCPRFESCPENLPEAKEEKDAEFICPPIPRVLPSPPLGPLTKTVPLNYWTPLGQISGTRPNVDQHSIARYSPEEYRERYQTFFKENNENVHNASLAVFNALRAMEKAFADTEKEILYNDIKLTARAGVLFKLKVELEKDMADIICEMGSIQEQKNRLQRCIHALDLVLSINNDMKNIRSLRMEPDLIRDGVDEEIIKEKILCEDILNVYKRCADHLNLQLQELKEAKKRLECDWSRKEETYEIDNTCRSLRSTSSNVLWKPGSVKIPSDQSTSSTYEQFCRESILQSQNALQRSRTLVINMKNIYETSVRDLRAQADRLDIALDWKIEESLITCGKLENKLSKCLQCMVETEAMIEKISSSVRKLDGAMKCTQTRLDNRIRREFVENCRDIPHFGLIDATKTLSENVTAVLAQKTRAEEVVSELTKSRKDIEKEIVIKRKSLYVDSNRCLTIRSFYPSVQSLAGY